MFNKFFNSTSKTDTPIHHIQTTKTPAGRAFTVITLHKHYQHFASSFVLTHHALSVCGICLDTPRKLARNKQKQPKIYSMTHTADPKYNYNQNTTNAVYKNHTLPLTPTQTRTPPVKPNPHGNQTSYTKLSPTRPGTVTPKNQVFFCIENNSNNFCTPILKQSNPTLHRATFPLECQHIDNTQHTIHAYTPVDCRL